MLAEIQTRNWPTTSLIRVPTLIRRTRVQISSMDRLGGGWLTEDLGARSFYSAVIAVLELRKTIHESPIWLYTSQNQPVKGTVSRDFLLLVFFLNQFPPSL